jgi:transcriptional regulator with XRE-family HTH domain
MNPQEINVHVGQRLRMRRTMLGLSQEAVGKGIGVASQQVQKYEKGNNALNVPRLVEFSEFLKVPISYFFEGLENVNAGGRGGKSMGMEEEQAEFEGEHRLASDRETIEILKSFKRIKDHALRKRVADLLRTLSLKEL